MSDKPHLRLHCLQQGGRTFCWCIQQGNLRTPWSWDIQLTLANARRLYFPIEGLQRIMMISRSSPGVASPS